MLVLKRYFDFEAADAFDGLSIYEGLLGELRVTVAEHLGISTNDLPSWPIGEWSSGSQSATGTEWRPETGSMRLLELTWQDDRPDYPWNLQLTLGCGDSGNVTLGEVWSVEASNRSLIFDSLPKITQFLVPRKPLNADGYIATQARGLRPDRIKAFCEYILSPTRTLPVVVVSPRGDGQERAVSDEFARDLMGMALVIRIELKAQDAFQDAMDPHCCYRDQIRLYMPGYQATDKQWVHRFWSRTAGHAEVKQEITDQVARESVIAQKSSFLEDLHWRWNEQLRSESAAARDVARQEARARLKAEQSIETYESYINELDSKVDELQADNDALREYRATLETQLGKKDDEIRQLHYRLRRSWDSEGDDVGGQQSELDVAIMLSRQARDAYLALDGKERNYWKQHIFPKLRSPEQRNNQMASIKSTTDGGTCFVFPRSRTGDGRRAIFYCEEDEVRICEIFTSAQHDRDYKQLRDEGVDRGAYQDFTVLEELVADAEQ